MPINTPYVWSFRSPFGGPRYKSSLYGAVVEARNVYASLTYRGLDNRVVLTHRPSGRTWTITDETNPDQIEAEVSAV